MSSNHQSEFCLDKTEYDAKNKLHREAILGEPSKAVVRSLKPI
jgi:hypothetical protein